MSARKGESRQLPALSPPDFYRERLENPVYTALHGRRREPFFLSPIVFWPLLRERFASYEFLLLLFFLVIPGLIALRRFASGGEKVYSFHFFRAPTDKSRQVLRDLLLAPLSLRDFVTTTMTETFHHRKSRRWLVGICGALYLASLCLYYGLEPQLGGFIAGSGRMALGVLLVYLVYTQLTPGWAAAARRLGGLASWKFRQMKAGGGTAAPRLLLDPMALTAIFLLPVAFSLSGASSNPVDSWGDFLWGLVPLTVLWLVVLPVAVVSGIRYFLRERRLLLMERLREEAEFALEYQVASAVRDDPDHIRKVEERWETYRQENPDCFTRRQWVYLFLL